jgi:hypothetical protein
MLLAVLSRTLKRILSQGSNSNGRVEREGTEIRKTLGTQSTNLTGRTESSIGSMVSGSNEKKISPDPWFN